MDQSQQQQQLELGQQQPTKLQQTGLSLRQTLNSSRINTNELKQSQQRQLDDNNSKDKNSKTIDTATSSNIGNVASNKKQQLQQQNSKGCCQKMLEESKESLKQKNKILINKYKLIRRTSSSSSTTNTTTTNATTTTRNFVKQKYESKGKDGTFGVVDKNSSSARKLKYKTPSPNRKTKQNSLFAPNYYRKINYILNEGKKDVTTEEKPNLNTAANTAPAAEPSTSTTCSSVIFKSPRRKVHMIMGDTIKNKFQQQRYSLVIKKPNDSKDATTSNAVTTLASTTSQKHLQTTQHVAGNKVVPQMKYI